MAAGVDAAAGQGARPDAIRDLPPAMADRLIVALDVDDPDRARALVDRLLGTVSFFKIGLWLLFQPGVADLIDRIVGRGGRVFLDCKMYDIGETVRRGIASVSRRGVSFVTVHGDAEIMRSAVAGRGDTGLKIFAVSVLTSLDDASVRGMGYGLPVRELVALRVREAAVCGCDGVIASPTDDPDAIRRLAGRDDLLVATPGIRLPGDALDDHRRPGAPDEAIARGADYLVVGRPIIHHDDPVARARAIIGLMEAGHDRRTARGSFL